MIAPDAEALLALGRDAKALLENEIYQRVVAHLREATMAEWRNTASGSTDLREALFFQVHGLDAVEAQLKGWIDVADYTAERIEQANAKAAQKRR